MKTKRVFSIILTLVFLLSFSTTAFAAEFTDVPDDHPYKAAIDFAFEKGYITGINETTFKPDAKLTRAEFATIWCRALEIEDTNHKFTDITKLKKYYD
ncbi:MAG TPA: S-layer homology domain-containing protein, partial [Candidatus Nitrosocosmicus sp.]|nr:S-layer homology domain-containing protein [Candidatus Nitrosocosmicus sp.]